MAPPRTDRGSAGKGARVCHAADERLEARRLARERERRVASPSRCCAGPRTASARPDPVPAPAGREGGHAMNGRKSSVRVTIVGEEYTIRSDASPEHTRAVADHVDRAIREIMNSGAVAETRKAAILAALQITDDLFRARAQSEEIAEGMQQLSSEIRRRLPPAKRVSGETAER